jgi:carbamate kinase
MQEEVTLSKLVVALGGNALQRGDSAPTAEAQLEVVRQTCQYIAELSVRGYELAIVHGNGPQVGRILLASETARDTVPPMPFDVCGAMSQGYIGYHIQQALRYALARRNRDIPVVTLLTQMVVEPEDPAFGTPTKPIGPFYTKEEAEALTKSKGYTMTEDAGRGYRRVVPSPMPRRIVEIGEVRKLWKDTIVVTCGGGGIPVVEKPDGTLEGVAAVIDKDFAAELLAEQMEADVLMILTEVEKVAIHWGKPQQQFLEHLSLSQAAQYVEEGHFAPGSMLPKVEAAMKFVRHGPGKKAIITSLDKALEALEGKTGTHITFA